MSYSGEPRLRPYEQQVLAGTIRPSVAVPGPGRLRVAPDPKRVAETRRFTQQRAAALGADEEAQATAALLVSEVVTNVVLHARTSALVDVTDRGDCICVSVIDGSPSRPQLRRHQPDEISGRGMRLVEDMAASAGVDGDATVAAGGKRVWFVIAKVTPPSSSS